MPTTIQEVYQKQILPLDEKQRLKLAALIISEISNKPESNTDTQSAGGISELFGSVSLGHPTGSDNDGIDADLAKAYADTHDDE